MPNHSSVTLRYFLTYSGVTLPLHLNEELRGDALSNRNTYFQAAFDTHGRMLWLEKRVYGDVEMRHDYEWDSTGNLCRATISTMDEEPQVREFALSAPEGQDRSETRCHVALK
jgi:hypothetical protein